MCRLAPLIAKRSMAARSRATPTILSGGRSWPTPAMPTRRGLGDEGECDASATWFRRFGQAPRRRHRPQPRSPADETHFFKISDDATRCQLGDRLFARSLRKTYKALRTFHEWREGKPQWNSARRQ